MKRLMTTLALVALIVMQANAMSYSRARNQALFLTDKMAYELMLTDDQYNACYEINLDYLMLISTSGDLFGIYWERRNSELSYVLTSAQFSRFIASEYFYRPVTWVNNRFYYSIYSRYERNRYFRPAPAVYETYRGGNRTYRNSAYNGRQFKINGQNQQPRTLGGGKSAQRPTLKKSEAIRQGRQQNTNQWKNGTSNGTFGTRQSGTTQRQTTIGGGNQRNTQPSTPQRSTTTNTNKSSGLGGHR